MEEFEYAPPPAKKSLDELIDDELNPLFELKQQLGNLVTEFDALLIQVKQEYAKYTEKNSDGHLFVLSHVSKELRQKLLVWHQKYQAILEQAIELKLVDQVFIQNYQNYGEEGWNRDENWNKVKNFYRQRDTAVEEIANLNTTIHSLDEGKKGRDFAYKVIGGIFIPTLVIPLIVLIIYAIDSKLTAKEILEKKTEKTDTENRKRELESNIETSGFGELKGNFCYQASRLSKPFFASLKTAKKEEAEKVEKTPPAPATPSPSHSDSED